MMMMEEMVEVRSNTVLPEFSIFNRQINSPSLEIDNDKEDEDSRDEVGEVGKVGTIESFLQCAHLVRSDDDGG